LNRKFKKGGKSCGGAFLFYSGEVGTRQEKKKYRKYRKRGKIKGEDLGLSKTGFLVQVMETI